ncbi:unnamed protein product [Rotaria magnacalcarata]|nr:unnamed protein product [Rotaria magnacalcarata]CAF4067083.1 unnamed protein product [Rotaria magnacalcarata]CAF4511366.1 unnamed protein product [Rotaria magnacalcarata]
MIDQSNRAGKLKINVGEDVDGKNIAFIPPIITATNQYNQSKQTRESQNSSKKLYRRTKCIKTPITSTTASASASSSAAVVSQRPPLSYMSKGKSV